MSITQFPAAPPTSECAIDYKEEIVFFAKEGCEDLLPVKKHFHDSGYDLKSAIDTVVNPGETVCIPTGLFTSLPSDNKDYAIELQVRSRSGLAVKNNIFVLNTPGTVDCGYDNEIGVILHNLGKDPFQVKRGDRIAQGVPALVVLTPAKTLKADNPADVVEWDKRPRGDRGLGGFGSTGVK